MQSKFAMCGEFVPGHVFVQVKVTKGHVMKSEHKRGPESLLCDRAQSRERLHKCGQESHTL